MEEPCAISEAATPPIPARGKWVGETARLCQPDRIFWCDASEEERKRLTTDAINPGAPLELNRKELPGCFCHRSDPSDVRGRKWIVDRCRGRADANETPPGWVPGAQSYNLEGMERFTPERLEQAQAINYEDWRRELRSPDELFMKLYSNLPKELMFQRELLVARL